MSRSKVRATGLEHPRMSWWTWLAILLAAAAIFFSIEVGSARTHPSWTEYTSTTLLTLSGVIQEVEYSNPHVMIMLEVPSEPEEDGTIEDPPTLLHVVLAPPSRSESRGMPREMVAVGAAATVEGYLHKTNGMELRAERITIGDITVELR
jgi:hypothetical protein